VGVSRPRNGLENGPPENLARCANLFLQFMGIGWCSSLSFPGLSLIGRVYEKNDFSHRRNFF
jgi:hypothetical protein